MAPRVDSPGLGVGLPVMAAIADALEIDTPGGAGTLVRMTFDVAARGPVVSARAAELSCRA